MTVLFAGVVVAALLLALALGGLARATQAHARAQGVADLAALAAAREVAHTGGPGCAVARQVVTEHGAQLAECAIDGVMVRVDVLVPVEPLPGWATSARAGARAGPVGWH